MDRIDRILITAGNGERNIKMNNVLSDNRKYKAMTAAEADALLEKIVGHKIEEVKLAAAYEKKLAAIKSEFEDKAEPIRKLMSGLALELEAYILNASPSPGRGRRCSAAMVCGLSAAWRLPTSRP